MERGRSRLIELEEEEDDDEMKMEKFYSLVRKLREARKRLRDHQMIISNELKKNKDEEMNKKRKSLVSVEEQSSTTCWVPCFVKEDFDQDVSFRKPVSPSLLPNPCNNKIKETQSHDALDFKLSF